MSYQVLARKYRPQNFSEVIGQEHVTRTLKNAIEQGRTAHGYIFSGHRGIGKTTVARILAMALNCRSSDKPVTEPCGVCESCTEIRAGNSVDVIEIDAATNRGIDEIRELREAARYRPARDRFKIYILDEAHQITDAAFNALLKTLEEPPSHVVFMLATTQPEDIPQTIRSRCQHFSFRAVRFEEILGQLKDLAGREKIEADEDALALIGRGRGRFDARCALHSGSGHCLLQRTTHGRCGAATGRRRAFRGAGRSDAGRGAEFERRGVAAGGPADQRRPQSRLISRGRWFAFCATPLWPRSPVATLPCCRFRATNGRGWLRVAELFSEEDLARHLQIMLRTHGELGYRQEQRFHLELGLLKMAHAQRLLPIEQLLSAVGAAGASGPRSAGKPTVVPDAQEARIACGGSIESGFTIRS